MFQGKLSAALTDLCCTITLLTDAVAALPAALSAAFAIASSRSWAFWGNTVALKHWNTMDNRTLQNMLAIGDKVDVMGFNDSYEPAVITAVLHDGEAFSVMSDDGLDIPRDFVALKDIRPRSKKKKSRLFGYYCIV